MSDDHVVTSVADSGPASSIFVDEAVSVTDGIRSTARWIASSFGAIPSLAVLTSIVRAPGNGGFDPVKLAFGVGLAALGAVSGVLFFAWVIAPIALEDDDVRKLDLRRIPGQRFLTFDELKDDIERLDQGVTKQEPQVAQRQAAARGAEARAFQHALAATKAELEASNEEAATSLKEAARQARVEAEMARRAAAAATAEAAAAVGSLSTWTAQLDRRYRIRQDAYRLAAADIVGKRFLLARLGALGSVALVASGIVLLGLAPKNSAGAGSAPIRHTSVAISSPQSQRPS